MGNITNEKQYRFERVCENPKCKIIFRTNYTNKKYHDVACRDEHYVDQGKHTQTRKNQPAEERLAMFNNQFLMMPLV